MANSYIINSLKTDNFTKFIIQFYTIDQIFYYFLDLSTNSLKALMECLKAKLDSSINLSVLRNAWHKCSNKKHLQGTLDSTILCIKNKH